MSKVITFSRKFPVYHPQKGQPTFFVEKFYNSIYEHEGDWSSAPGTQSDYVVELDTNIREAKHHTIREGNHWKVGDVFSPRVWSGKPYASKQIILASDVVIKQIYKFSVTKSNYYLNGKKLTYKKLLDIAKNDGLTLDHLELWFQKPFRGQVICWSENIKY